MDVFPFLFLISIPLPYFYQNYNYMNLFVAGLPYDVDDQELQQIFEEYGTVGSAKVILDKETRKSRGFGFVEMPDEADAQKAISALNEASLEGRKLTVKVAEERKSGGGGGGYRGGGGGGNRGGGGYNKGGGGFNRDRNRY
jgi:RNA recognition motif-containing protein